jgi:Protein of unknown function (DUF2946)
MFSQKLFRCIARIALLAMTFASLAPSISHALAAQQAKLGFLQQICATDGKKVTIQVTTSKGQKIAAEFAIKAPVESTPTSIQHHLQHCPFCSAGAAAAVLPSNNAVIIAQLEISAQKIAQYATPVLVNNTYNTPPSQAPPSLLA